MLCDDLEGLGWAVVGGRLKRERIYVNLRLIHIVVQQKLTSTTLNVCCDKPLQKGWLL